MRRTTKVISLLFLGALFTSVASSEMQFLTIGNPGNAPDTRIMSDGTTNYGAVSYIYNIATYEVTNAQWNEFAPGHSSKFLGDTLPVQNVSWNEAAQYCNWLTTGDKFGGAYVFDQGGSFLKIDREAAMDTYGTIFVLPTEDEWHKAAYSKDGNAYQAYATPTDVQPTTTESNYGKTLLNDGPWDATAGVEELHLTHNMMGNVWEWTETSIGAYLVLRGGAYDTQEGSHLSANYRHYIAVPSGEYDNVGFRIATVAVPEPTCLMLLALGGLALNRRKRPA